MAALQSLAPDRNLNESFIAIVRDGTGKTFEGEHNRRWLEVTRPIVEAFFHSSRRGDSQAAGRRSCTSTTSGSSQAVASHKQ